MSEDPATARWHIDRRIPLAQIASLLAAVAAGAWFMADQNSRLKAVEGTQQVHDVRIGSLEAGGSDFKADLARMTALLESIDARLARQESRIERFPP